MRNRMGKYHILESVLLALCGSFGIAVLLILKSTEEGKILWTAYEDYFRVAIILEAVFIAAALIIAVVALTGGFGSVRRRAGFIKDLETDSLTGLDARVSGERKIRRLMEKKIPGMFLLFDVDKFKSLNESLGYSVGDRVLLAVSECMRTAFRDRDILMRVCSDEFAVYVPNVRDEETGMRIIERFFEEIYMVHPEELKGRPIEVSLGATLYTADGTEDYAAAYRRASRGVTEGKKTVGNQVHFVNSDR